MSLHRHLRLCDENTNNLRLLSNRLLDGEVLPLDKQSRFLTAELYDDHTNRATVWFDVDRWLNTLKSQLPEVPWLEVPLTYLANWMTGLGLIFTYAEKPWRVEQISIPRKELPSFVVMLPASPVPIGCVDWPITQEDQRIAIITGKKMPFPVKYSFGYSKLSLAQFVDVAPGDLLLINQLAIFMIVGKRRVFEIKYTLSQEVIVQEVYQEDEYENEPYEGDEPLYQWEELEFNLEFVLEGETMTVAQLEQIQLGSIWKLPKDAEQNMKIYVNKKFFARGELVALENGRIGVELKQVNPSLLEQTGSSDVE